MEDDITTKAAEWFVDSASMTWTMDEYRATVVAGLAEPDADALVDLCEQYGEDYATAEAEVLATFADRVQEYNDVSPVPMP